MNTVAAKIPSVFHRNVDAEGTKKRGEHERSFNNKEKNPGCTTPNPHPTTTPKPTHNPTPNDLHQKPDPSTSPPENTPTPSSSPLPNRPITSSQNTHTPRPSPSTQPRPKYPPPPRKSPLPTPHSPYRPPPPKKKKLQKIQKKKIYKKKKKKKTHWRGGVSLRSRSGHPGVGSWGAETNPPLGGHPGVGAKSGGEGRRPPSFQLTTRNEQGTRQPNRHNSKCRTRPDGGHVSV